ncbi:hypothetical protein HNQ71_006650 [Mesorhizobium sangaii]|uniref:Uncharacterized protein n=1 Tax=Mesorhizobium sangaii TaxID=505389 RepID=A0A841PIY3_9HYPH|nr:hypothetical protein [Mesorhizobium sangaii]
MFLAHRRGKPLFEAAKELAERAVAISVGMTSSILLPQNEECDARLLELDGKMGPVRLCATPRAPLTPWRAKSLFSSASSVSSLGRGQLNPICRCGPQIILHRTACYVPCIERARRKLCQTNGQQVCDRAGSPTRHERG